VAVGDFDGDVLQDVVVASGLGHTVELYKSNLGGTFSLVDMEFVSAPQSLALGDFVMDGRLDLVVAEQGSSLVSMFEQARPLPSASDSTYAFTAPAGSRVFYAGRGPDRMLTDWDYTSRGAPGATSFAFPLPSTLASARPAPSGQAVSWWVATYTYPAGAPFNYDNFRNPFVRSTGGADGLLQSQGHVFIRP
jgi:hypothetical protein